MGAGLFSAPPIGTHGITGAGIGTGLNEFDFERTLYFVLRLKPVDSLGGA